MKCREISADNADVVNRATWSSEEIEVPRARLVDANLSTGIRLIVGIPGHRNANMAVSEVDQARAVDAVGRYAAPHVRHAD
jgi:hypothetical protein